MHVETFALDRLSACVRAAMPGFRRLCACVSLLVLVLGLCLAVPQLAGAAAVPSPARYEKAKENLDKLYKDTKRNQWREPWQKLADEFHDIYLKEKGWVNRPAALFRSALALDELSRRSFVKKDAETAVRRYKLVFENHRTNPLADDALLHTAKLQAERLHDVPAAISTVEQLCSIYPRSDECRQGRDFIKSLTTDSGIRNQNGKTTAKNLTEQPAREADKPASILSLKWDTKGQVVKIEIELDKPPAWELRSSAGDAKSNPTLTLDLGDSRPDPSVSHGGKITGSSLKRVRLDYHKSGMTRILLDYSKLALFSIRAENGGKKLVIQTTITPSALPGGLEPGNSIRSQRAAADERRRSAQSNEQSQAFMVATRNMASQFGLSVRTVIIDPGHGGKDPGTHHNGILERDVVLDLAKRLGKALKAEGFDVKYTRTGDTFVSLNDRVKIANQQKGDLFISIHINASPNEKKTGFETYFLDVSSSAAAASLASFENMLSNRKLGDLETIISDLMKGARKDESVRLARDVQQKTINRLKQKGHAVENGGSRGAPFVVLMGTNMPAVLVEVGYCTNKQEAKKLASPAYRNALAQGISEGVVAYAERLRKAQGK